MSPSKQAVPLDEIKVLKGKTLLIYWMLLKKGEPVGLRDLQRELGFSSPSLASYHLTKLTEVGLVDKTKVGEYFVVRKAPIAELRDLIVFRVLNHTLALPRQVFFAVFFSLVTLGYLLVIFPFFEPQVTSASVFVLILGLGASGSFWFEAWRSLKDLPF